MGERSFRVCDAKVEGKVCNERNTEPCVICELDFCPSHRVKPTVAINVTGSGVTEIAKIEISIACFRCLNALKKTAALFADIKPEDVIRHARAHLSAQALK